MHLVFLELPQEVIYLLRLRHKVWRPDKALPAEVGRLGKMRQKILDIEHAPDVVGIVLVNGNTAVIVVNDTAEHLVVSGADVQVHHVLPAGHHLLGCLVAKADDALQHALLVFYLILVRQFQRMLQLAYAQLVIILQRHLLGQYATAHQDRGEWLQQLI